MGDFKFYLTVVLPVSRTSLVTLGDLWIFNFMEYVFMAIIDDDK